jgi:tetratricopeptide (TPR) repeat protein
MAAAPDNFDTLYRQAGELRNMSRHQDAATFYERALRAPGGTEADRCWAKFWLADSLSILGRPPEALAHYGELYAATKNRVEFHELAYRAFHNQIQELWLVQQNLGTRTEVANVNKRLELIAEGLAWLRDIGREEWRHALLWERAEALDDAGDLEQALDIAEEAYRISQEARTGPGYVLEGYARQVARLARRCGRPEHALQVLDDIAGNYTSPRSEVIGLEEYVRVLRAFDPPRLAEAIDVARRLARLSREIQAPLSTLLAHDLIADCAIAAQSFAEALEALRTVRQIALDDVSFERAYLLRQAQNALRRAQRALADHDDTEAQTLSQTLETWLEELQQAPGIQAQGDTVDA